MPPDKKADGLQLITLSLGHAVVDSYGFSLIAPLFPVLAERLGLGLDQIGGLPLLMGLSASLGQPIIGRITDHWRRIPVVALGPALAAVSIGMVSFAWSYPILAVCLLLAGVGIGAYHPQGASLARVAARGRGLAMSSFTVGGNIGFGLAPLLGAIYFKYFGLERFYVACVPGLVFATFMFAMLHQAQGREPRRAAAPREPRGTGNPVALALLTGTVAVRAGVQIAVSTFLAFLLRDRLPESDLDKVDVAALSLAVFLLANAVSGPIGGHLSDRFGRRPVMIVSLAAAPLIFTLALGLPGFWMVAGLAAGGFMLMLPQPANVVMAQEYLPSSAGVAASMITGVAWGVGQLLCWPLGILAEQTSVEFALRLIVWLPLLGVLMVLPLRDPRSSE